MTQKDYEKRMKNTRYKELRVTKAEDEKDYVFISYRGDSWEKVLTDIVYKLQKEYGLRIYFDKDFAASNNIWIEQFTDNMESKYCKAFLCFFDEGYVTSYATLLELMYAMNGRCKNLHGQMYAINFQIDWDKLNDKDDDTGLGSPDNNNPGWREEKQEFDEAFELLKEENDYKDIRKYYSPRKKLKACNCKDIMAVLQPKNRREYVDTDDFYKQFIVNPLKKSCPSVFGEIDLGENFKNYVTNHIIICSSDKKTFEFYKEHKFTLSNKKVYIGIRDIEGSLLKTIPDAVVFDINNMIARGLWKKLGMWKEGKEKLDIVIYGSSNLAGGIVSTGLQMNIFSLNQHINYHFITDNKLYRIRHKNLQLMNSDRLEYYSTDDENIWEIIENADKVIVADEVEVELLQTIILSANNSKVYYYYPEDGDMGSYIEYRKPVPFGRYKDVFTEENILREKLTEKAKALHNYYESICNTGKKWEDLSGFLRASNISAADFGNILADLNKDEMELAELEHIRWCRFYFLNYYKYGEVRNDAKRIHNDLVWFDELSLEEQEKDLDAVRVLKKLVKEN